MKTGTTRLICLILSLVMLVGMLPTAYATEVTETQQTETTAATEPTQETTAPTEATTAPTEETTAPTEETTAPTEETTAPTEETVAPTEETTAPTEATTAPTEETVAPTEETTVPTETATEEGAADGAANDDLPGAVSTFSIEEVNGGFNFTTFAELKELASRSYDQEVLATYTGEGRLVISEDLVLPRNLALSCAELYIPQGVTLDASGHEISSTGIQVGSLVVDGTISSVSTTVRGELTVNGIFNNYHCIDIISETSEVFQIVGRENIKAMREYTYIFKKYSANSIAEIQALIDAEEPSEPSISYYAELNGDAAVAGTLDIPDNWCVAVDGSFTIPSGSSVTVSGGLDILATCTVSGELTTVNNGAIFLYGDGRIQVLGGASFTASCITEADPKQVIQGVNWDHYEIENNSPNGWTVRYVGTAQKLSTPTDLVWGIDYTMSSDAPIDVPGIVSWKVGELHQGWFKICCYQQGTDDLVFEREIRFAASEEQKWFSDDCFLRSSPESGSYYFTIIALGDGINYRNSDPAVSPIWSYIKPEEKLETVFNLNWSWPWTRWSNPDTSKAFGLDWEILYSPSANGTPYYIGGAGTCGFFLPEELDLSYETAQTYGVGYYFFRVRMISRDITTICNGDWSELSPAYYLDSIPSDNVNYLLDTILSGQGSNAEKIQAVQNMDSAELKSAMLADEKTVEKIQQLENTAAGGPADVVVSDQVPAFSGSQVSVTGANLNVRENAGESVSLVIDKPEADHILPTQFDNALSVKFSMTLENVPDPDNLQVPVLISLPVPQNINPDFLVILHYHADGSYEQVWPNITYTSSGAYAEFAVTRFSDFVMTQLADESETTQPMYRLYNPYTLEHLFTSGEWEKDNLPNAGWIYEGVAWEAPTTGTPIYRLYNPYSDGHFYTASEAEIDTLLPLGWQLDGVVTCGADSSGTPIYRLFNPYETKNYHHYTTSWDEINMLTALGWILEGIAWYAA